MTGSFAIRGALIVALLWLGFFAGWTLVSVPLTLFCAPFQSLWAAFGVGLLGAGCAVLTLQRQLAPVLLTPAITPTGSMKPVGGANILLIGGGTIAILSAAALFIPTSNAWPLWFVTIVVGGISLAMRGMPSVTSEPELPAEEAAATWVPAILLVVMILALYIMILRPDADDSFYLNLPVGLISAQSCMMSADTMYGTENWPILGSNYRVEALPTLVAALSAVTGLQVITVAHFVVPVIWCVVWASVLIVIGHGLFGRHWWVFAFLAVLASMTFGGTLQTWGVHGIARMFHGKAPLILIVFPLLVYLTLRAEASKTRFGITFAVMFGLCTVALGLTANAIYLAPLVLLLALVSARIALPGAPVTRLTLITASAVPVCAGLWLFLFDRPVSANPDADWSVSTSLAVWNMASDKLIVVGFGLTLGIAAIAARFGPMGRGVTAYLVLFFLIAINPILWPIYDRFVTGGLTFRMWWALPLPMFLAIGMTWGIVRTRWVRLGTLAAGAGLTLLAMLPSGLIGMDGTQVRPTMQKIPLDTVLAVQEVLAAAPAEGTVLAPEQIAAWLPIWEGHPALVYTRPLYFKHNAQAVEPARLAPRILLAEWINGEGDHAENDILDALAELNTGLVVIPVDVDLPLTHNILERTENEFLRSFGPYEVYRISF